MFKAINAFTRLSTDQFITCCLTGLRSHKINSVRDSVFPVECNVTNRWLIVYYCTALGGPNIIVIYIGGLNTATFECQYLS